MNSSCLYIDGDRRYIAKLPRLGAPVNLQFSTLRARIHPDSLGVIPDCDEQVVRRCRRARCKGGWKWQIIDYSKNVEWDCSLEVDKEILDMHGSDLEFEILVGKAKKEVKP